MKFYSQLQATDCGAACLAMIYSYYGKKTSLDQVKKFFEQTRVGVSIQEIIDASSKLGLDATPIAITLDQLEEIPLPCILHWKQDHFVVLENINSEGKYFISDPAYGKTSIDKENFEIEWKGVNEKGISLVFEQNKDFDNVVLPIEIKKPFFKSVFFSKAISYFKGKKLKYTISLLFLIISLGVNWVIPSLFQKIIDLGILKKSLNVVYTLLIAQMVFFLSGFISSLISNVLLTKLNFQLSILLKNELLRKLMRLPINYFDTRLNTETLQRLGDQNKIQTFLTWKSIDFIVNTLNIFVFGILLYYYNFLIFSVYFFITFMSILWILFFLKKRSILEYSMFLKQSQNNNYMYEFVMNMPEIKINNAQNQKIDKILNLQKSLNLIELKSLHLNIYQNFGVNFLSKFKEIIAIGISAFLIMEGNMTLGAMLSISYILGQLLSPVNNMVGFIRDIQDVKISNKRIEEIYSNSDENNDTKTDVNISDLQEININNVYFKYPGKFNPNVLNNISTCITKDSVTAIVGVSGSGKTTLMKLFLSYYKTSEGNISLGDKDLSNFNSDQWRDNCGIVLQDGHIFSGTIAENIAISDEQVDYEKMKDAAKIACINDFIETLPMGYNTKVGNVGIQLSGGQKQRLLIARAVYKDPAYLFFDEATSSLDAENEKKIHDNLQQFFVNKTVIIIAHRLSTVKNANKIIVLNKGKLVEEGNHKELITKKGEYYQLVKNQLELGN